MVLTPLSSCTKAVAIIGEARMLSSLSPAHHLLEDEIGVAGIEDDDFML
jgi:hypothetical protein